MSFPLVFPPLFPSHSDAFLISPASSRCLRSSLLGSIFALSLPPLLHSLLLTFPLLTNPPHRLLPAPGPPTLAELREGSASGSDCRVKAEQRTERTVMSPWGIQLPLSPTRLKPGVSRPRATPGHWHLPRVWSKVRRGRLAAFLPSESPSARLSHEFLWFSEALESVQLSCKRRVAPPKVEGVLALCGMRWGSREREGKVQVSLWRNR